MDIRLLIDAIVRQTTVLVAQLATSGGARAPLADVANQVFVNLAKELHDAGISRKVSADMFGMALRTYRRKLQRLEESHTFRGQSIWYAVRGQLRSDVAISQAQVLATFSQDDPDVVRSILNDLSETGLAFRSGMGRSALYKSATPDEEDGSNIDRGLDELVWTIIYRDGPLSQPQIASRLGLQEADLTPAVKALLSDGRIEPFNLPGGPQQFHAVNIVIPVDAPAGWEAAVFDHYASVVQTICAKLDRMSSRSPHETIGGSTYTFDISPEHPHAEEVMETLKAFRERNTALRQKVQNWNKLHPDQPQNLRVTCYAGQNQTDASLDQQIEKDPQ